MEGQGFSERTRALSHLGEPAMRAAALNEQLLAAAPREAVHWLEALVRGAVHKEAAALAVYGAMVDPAPLARGLSLVELARLAMEERCVAALQWLTSARAEREPDRADTQKLVHKDLRQLTLGERRALARRATSDEVKRLLVDPDRQVIDNLLRSPRATEAVVLAIASHRPTISAPLEVVLGSRWGWRYRVRLALARNPCLWTPLAVNLLPCLDRPDLVQLRDDGVLAPAVRMAAQRLLEIE